MWKNRPFAVLAHDIMIFFGGGRNEKKNDKDEERVVYIIVVVTKYNSKFLLLGFSFFLVARLALFPPTVTQLTVSLLM